MLVTTPFVELARSEARALGFPDVRLIELPHPIGGIDQDELAGIARLAVTGIRELCPKPDR